MSSAIVVMGPTASGKTTLSRQLIRVARSAGVERQITRYDIKKIVREELFVEEDQVVIVELSTHRLNNFAINKKVEMLLGEIGKFDDVVVVTLEMSRLRWFGRYIRRIVQNRSVLKKFKIVHPRIVGFWVGALFFDRYKEWEKNRDQLKSKIVNSSTNVECYFQSKLDDSTLAALIKPSCSRATSARGMSCASEES